jgi:xanthine dehydrogenase molybdopterin binding subunit/xanthine dehydrogenase small subunit
MVEHYGSQCGYCTPGFIGSMVEGYYRADCRTPDRINDQLCGNLCRCTGYRAIRDAALAAFGDRAGGAPSPLADRLSRPVGPLGAVAYGTPGGTFFRPTTLAELLALLQANPGARLVAGATEIGVEINKRFREFPGLVSTEAVPELNQLEATPEGGWRIGASVTLTAIEEKVAPAYPALARMLRWFAARQVRNRATLGGNLATASPIGDSAPALLALDATLVLASVATERTVPLAEFFTGYRRTLLGPGEVIREIVLPPFTPAAGCTRRSDFIKVSHRRELDISITSAAFVLDVDSAGVVRHARLAYGGVAERPVRAVAAERALIGHTVDESSEAVATALAAAFTPITDLRGGADYRRALVGSLWERFRRGEPSEVHDAAANYTASAAWTSDDASRRLRHESAVGHVTGAARYVEDAALRRSTLVVGLVRSPHAHATITRRDAARARSFPGVTAVLLAEDIPGHNNTGPIRHDEPLLATDGVSFHGQVVAIVVGESAAVCRAAAAAVDVDYVPRPPIVGLPAALAAESFHAPPHRLVRGDCAEALAAAPLRFTGEFAFGGQEHFYLETQGAWAEPGEDGTFTVHSSTQHPSEVQAVVAEVLGCARNRVVVLSPRMGGGFGGKETQGNFVAAITALAASHTGRPVRLQLDRDDDMELTGKRHPFLARFDIGHDADGRVTAARIELFADGGWSLDLSIAICDRALFHLDNAYYLPAVDFSGRVARTHTTSNTAFRGFGGPQGMLVIEEIMDRVARRVRLAPELVRTRNLYHGDGETNRTHYAQDIGDNRLEEMWAEAQTRADFAARRASIDAWNRTETHVKRGLAITPVKFGISFTMTHYNQAGALVHAYQDGSIQINHGGTEMGQGLHTKVLGVAMRELGLPAEAFRLMPSATDKVPNTSATAASSGADLNGAAVAAACAELRRRLAPVAARMLSGEGAAVSAEEVTFTAGGVQVGGDSSRVIAFAALCRRAYAERISLSATGFYRTEGIHWDWTHAAGRPFKYFAGGVAISEVVVDGRTGMHRVQRVDILHDVGDSLNPGIDRGQIEGGFVQGMGWLTSEELKWNAQGRLLTHSASTYQIPAISDAPDDFRVTLLPRAANAGAIHGSKAVGEPPFMLAISVREALRDAARPGGRWRWPRRRRARHCSPPSSGGWRAAPEPAASRGLRLSGRARSGVQPRC